MIDLVGCNNLLPLCVKMIVLGIVERNLCTNRNIITVFIFPANKLISIRYFEHIVKHIMGLVDVEAYFIGRIGAVRIVGIVDQFNRGFLFCVYGSKGDFFVDGNLSVDSNLVSGGVCITFGILPVDEYHGLAVRIIFKGIGSQRFGIAAVGVFCRIRRSSTSFLGNLIGNRERTFLCIIWIQCQIFSNYRIFVKWRIGISSGRPSMPIIIVPINIFN